MHLSSLYLYIYIYIYIYPYIHITTITLRPTYPPQNCTVNMTSRKMAMSFNLPRKMTWNKGVFFTDSHNTLLIADSLYWLPLKLFASGHKNGDMKENILRWLPAGFSTTSQISFTCSSVFCLELRIDRNLRRIPVELRLCWISYMCNKLPSLWVAHIMAPHALVYNVCLLSLTQLYMFRLYYLAIFRKLTPKIL
jgi:hypothetical protein